MIRRIWFLPLGVVLLFGVIYAAGWFDTRRDGNGGICTQEAKQCPDGSYVGRQGITCEFAPCPTATVPDLPTTNGPVNGKRTVRLSFYLPERDLDPSGNPRCTADGIVAVIREVPFDNTPIQTTIRALLTSSPTSAEDAQGIVSQLPLEKVTLQGASLADGVLTLTFNDPDHRTSGGACFVGILSAQIQETAKQFDGVRSVILKPDDLFQP